ncbi:MAG: gluconokinase [Acidithiobacillus sp.]|uniref:gluconokinase n=1 Tax=Acidithiobacillus sp. TaxID=1872118 RepID=UPI003D080AB2
MAESTRTVDIAIDVGTSVLKVAAVDGEERIIAQRRSAIPLLQPAPGAALQDVLAIEGLLRDLLQALANDLGKRYRVERVAWSCAMHSLLLADGHGQPLGPAYTWLDGRAATVARDCWDHGPGRRLYERTGTPIHPISPLIKLRWLRQTAPTELTRARHVLSIKEWLWWRSFGSYEVDAATASASGLLDIHCGQWSAEALAYVDLDTGRLSRLVDRKWQRPLRPDDPIFPPQMAGASVYLGASDGVLAQWGMGAFREDVLGVSLGTSMAVRRYAARPQLSRRTRNFAYRVDDHHWLVGTASNNGGPLLDWVRRRGFGAETGFAEALAAAARATPSSLLCLPFLEGERAPLWRAEARAAFLDIDARDGPAEFLRAAVEGLFFTLRWLCEDLQARAPHPAKRLIASGHLFQTPWAAQLLADMLALPVQVAADTDVALLGAIRWARQDSASTPDRSSAAVTPSALLPQSHHEDRYRRFRKAAQALYS